MEKAGPNVAENRELDSGADELTLEPAPDLPYLPIEPKHPPPPIGVIGCGGIVPYHLNAYSRAGYRVVALCDIQLERAEAMRAAHYPDAAVYTDYRELLDRPDVAVLDIATHPEIRADIIESALRSGRHVLSQKPFVTDLDVGERLVRLADELGLKLAVNQNGRWAPHISYIRQAISNGLLGEVMSAHVAVHWDHSWTRDTVFDNIRHLILFDFAIHWFDMINCFMGDELPERVYASMRRAPEQPSSPCLLAEVMVAFRHAQASLVFDAFTRYGAKDTTYVAGTKGSIVSTGPDLNHQTLTHYSGRGYSIPELRGDWFTNGFHGTMAELLCAIEEKRQPSNSARHNLRSLALCFAAIASAESGEPKTPGEIRRLTVN